MSSELSSFDEQKTVKSESSCNESDDWKVNCSDEETYGDINNYRIVNGKRIWEPKGEDIATLYSQLEKKGFIELKWQCPGRRSPSVHSATTGHEKKGQDYGDVQNKTIELNEFDFDDEFGSSETNSIATKVTHTRRRTNQGPKRSMTNLNKVMMDMKKYHIHDQQSKKSVPQTSVQTSSGIVTSQPSQISSNQYLISNSQIHTSPTVVNNNDLQQNLINTQTSQSITVTTESSNTGETVQNQN